MISFYEPLLILFLNTKLQSFSDGQSRGYASVGFTHTMLALFIFSKRLGQVEKHQRINGYFDIFFFYYFNPSSSQNIKMVTFIMCKLV